MEDRQQLLEAMEWLEKNIDKEIAKLKYYVELADELIENDDYIEMEIAIKQGTQIIEKIGSYFAIGRHEVGLWSFCTRCSTMEEG